MAGIAAPLTGLLTKLREILVTNGDGAQVQPYVRVWNNQIAYLAEGKMEAFPLPAFFVEIVNNPTYDIIGQGYRSTDLSFRIHIVHEFYDAMDGTFEQDLAVFELRDKVTAYLTGFGLPSCGPLECMNEAQDFEHTNLYHYILDFVCNFTDSIGSRYSPSHPDAFITKTPVTNLELTSQVAHGGGQRVTKEFIID
jgi:hypothetical protein